MLLALALTAVLITVTGRIAVQTLESQASFERMGNTARRADLVFDQFAADLQRLLPGLPGETSPLRLFGTPRQVLEFSALASTEKESESLHTAFRPATVRYRLAENSDFSGARSLTREVRDRTELGAVASRETIAEHLEEFKVEVFSRGQWVTGFAPNDPSLPIPTAVRVALHWTDDSQPQTRTFLVADDR